MTKTKEELLALVSEMVGDEAVSRDQATVIEAALKLDGDEAMLAARLVGGGGADPATLAYLRDGEVDAMVAKAHREGPGVYSRTHQGRKDYLTLCSYSEDEAQDSTLRDRVLKYVWALIGLGAVSCDHENDHHGKWADVEIGYLDLPYVKVCLGGASVRLYTSDGGHAAGVWDPEDPQAATAVYGIFNGDPYIAIGAPPYHPPLELQGFDRSVASKHHTPRFWIIEDPGVVGDARFALLANSATAPSLPKPLRGE